MGRRFIAGVYTPGTRRATRSSRRFSRTGTLLRHCTLSLCPAAPQGLNPRLHLLRDPCRRQRGGTVICRRAFCEFLGELFIRIPIARRRQRPAVAVGIVRRRLAGRVADLAGRAVERPCRDPASVSLASAGGWSFRYFRACSSSCFHLAGSAFASSNTLGPPLQGTSAVGGRTLSARPASPASPASVVPSATFSVGRMSV